MPTFIQRWRRASCGLMIACCLGFTSVTATAQETSVTSRHGEAIQITNPVASLELIESTAKVIQFREWLTRVDGFDPKIIAVTALDRNVLRIQGLSQGVTTMVVTDKSGQAYSVEVFVTGDARMLKSILKRAFPGSAIEVTTLRNNAVLLRGWVTDAQQISSITELAEIYSPNVINQIKVGGPQEVQLRVKVMEVQRSKLRNFGFNFAVATSSLAVASTPGGLTPLTSLTAPIGGTPVATIGPGSSPLSLSTGITGNHFGFQGFLQALKEEGLLKIAAEPVLVTRSGEAARLINGGEFPIPVPQSLGTVTIEWREFGVVLEALPIVISPTRLRQQVHAEVSERDVANGITMGGTFVPGLTRRSVQSVVEMEFGQTLILGGLVSTRITGSTSKTPFLGELPGIGAAFSRKRHDQSEVELIVMITPEYVSPLNADQLPPLGPGRTTTSPNDRELYKHGLLEVPKSGPDCPDGASCDPNFSVKVQTGTPWPGGSMSSSQPVPVQQQDGGGASAIVPAPSSNSETTPELIAPQGVNSSGNKAGDLGASTRSPSGMQWPAASRPTSKTGSPTGETASGATQARYESSGSRTDGRIQQATGQRDASSRSLPPVKF